MFIEYFKSGKCTNSVEFNHWALHGNVELQLSSGTAADLPTVFLLPQVTVVVLGNKSDLRERRQVEHEAAQQWARGEKVKLWEVSVTERTSLIEPFTQLTSRLTQPQSKSAFPLPGRKSKGTPSNDI